MNLRENLIHPGISMLNCIVITHVHSAQYPVNLAYLGKLIVYAFHTEKDTATLSSDLWLFLGEIFFFLMHTELLYFMHISSVMFFKHKENFKVYFMVYTESSGKILSLLCLTFFSCFFCHKYLVTFERAQWPLSCHLIVSGNIKQFGEYFLRY